MIRSTSPAFALAFGLLHAGCLVPEVTYAGKQCDGSCPDGLTCDRTKHVCVDSSSGADQCTTGTLPKASTLRDDFQSAERSATYWESLLGDPCARVENGEAVFAPSSAPNSLCRFDTKNYYDLGCDAIRFKVSQTTNFAAVTQTDVYLTTQDGSRLLFFLSNSVFAMYVENGDKNALFTVPYNADRDAFWSLGTTSTTFEFSTSADGIDYHSPLASVPLPFSLRSVQVSLGAYNVNSTDREKRTSIATISGRTANSERAGAYDRSDHEVIDSIMVSVDARLLAGFAGSASHWHARCGANLR